MSQNEEQMHRQNAIAIMAATLRPHKESHQAAVEDAEEIWEKTANHLMDRRLKISSSGPRGLPPQEPDRIAMSSTGEVYGDD